MQIHVVPAAELAPSQAAAWSRWQQADAALDSPLFRPEFTQAVAAVRDGVEVAVLEEDGQSVGFFPFQREPGNVGIPVAGRLCDFQGVVVRQGVAWTAAELVRGSGLSVFHFHAALACQEPFQRCGWGQVGSAYIDISGGFEAYQKKLRDSGSEEMRKTGQKARKMQREIGPLRFEPQTTDQRVLQTLIQWKLQQYRRTKAVNFLAGAWKITLLENLLQCQGSEFSGMLSALYAGDRLVAAHFGLRSAGVLHGWFPAYDPEFAKYSPGQVFWQQLLQAACTLGIRRIDLARGEERFKSSLMSGAIRVVEGSVDFRHVRKLIRRSWFYARRWIRSTPLRALARGVARNTRAWLGSSK